MIGTKDVSTLKDNFSADTVSIISADYNSDVPYFTYSQTKDYFPTLNVDPDYLPLGSSKPYCLHLDWIEKFRMAQKDQYKSVAN